MREEHSGAVEPMLDFFFRIMSELDLDLSFEDTPTEEADAEEEIVDPLTLIQETLEDLPPLPIMVDMVNEEDDISNDTLPQPERSSLFKNDPMLPIYAQWMSSGSTKDVVELIVNGVQDFRSAKLVPSQPAGNYVFMVATSFLSHWKDVLSDDFGTWTPNGTKTYHYTSTFHQNGQVKAQYTNKGVEDDAVDVVAKR